jgi:hypothetical protein
MIMSNADSPNLSAFGKFVPGFDFLQNLATHASGSAAQKTPGFPSLGSWVAPTLSVEELEKRIQELKAVQFWLDQNATALKATIQALEVQKMTLATLKGMNFNMTELAKAFTVKSTATGPAGDNAEPAQAPHLAGLPVSSADKDAAASGSMPETGSAAEKPPSTEAGRSAGLVDPMQWWGALTEQFQGIAADAMRDAAKNAALLKAQGEASPGGTVHKPGARTTRVKTGVARGGAVRGAALRSSDAWPLPVAQKSSSAKPAPKAKRTAPAKAARKSAR